MALEKQPVLNIGCLGSTTHGKSTLVKLLTGKSTQQHSKEKIKNITMKVGYANAKIYKCDDGSLTTNTDESDDLVHHFSFVDCPGHHELIEVMMSGANLMDGGIVVVAGNQSISEQPQLKQHLLTAKLIGIKKLIFILNKLDLITSTLAQDRKHDLIDYLKEFDIIDPIIIPMALNLGLNKKYLLEAIYKEFPPVSSKEKKDTIFSISRSFDINKPGISPLEIKGGVVGGSVLTGNLELEDKVFIFPGQMKFNPAKKIWMVKPLSSKVISLKSETDCLDKISCGGLTAIGLEIDSFFTQNDKLKGTILVKNKELVKVYINITCEINLLDNSFKLKNDMNVQLQIGCNTIIGKVKNIKKNIVEFELNKPIPVYDGVRVLLSEKKEMVCIIGVGSIKSGKEVVVV